MVAASIGTVKVAEVLLKFGASPQLLTPTGHTAADLAMFLKHESMSNLLSITRKKDGTEDRTTKLFFDDSPLTRNSVLRGNVQSLVKVTTAQTSKFIPMYKTGPIVIYDAENKKKNPRPRPLKLSYDSISTFLEPDFSNVCFLGGIESPHPCSENNVDSLNVNIESEEWFAFDIDNDNAHRLMSTIPNTKALSGEIRSFPVWLGLDPEDAAICGHARSLLDWRSHHLFCSMCGSETSVTDGGYKLLCSNANCGSHKGEIPNIRRWPDFVSVVCQHWTNTGSTSYVAFVYTNTVHV